MQATIVSTFPFIFPHFPRGKALISKFRQGADGQFGIAIDHDMDYEHELAMCSFFTFDLRKNEVVQRTMTLPYSLLGQIDICYDQCRKAWYVAIGPLIYGRPIDIYRIPEDQQAPWTNVFTTQRFQSIYHIERGLVRFWQCGNQYPLLFCILDSTMMYDIDTYQTQWGEPQAVTQWDQPPLRYLNTNYRREVYPHQDGYLLLTLQCTYDAMTSTPLYRKMGSGQWHFHLAAYTQTGELIHQEMIPNIIMTVRDKCMASHDLTRWLTNSIRIGDGPLLQATRKPTCIAALVMQDNPDAKRGPDDPLLSFSNQGREAKGGLYCIDIQGHILCYDPSLVGLRTSFCVCSDQVIGATFQDGQWQLWDWHPLQGTARMVHSYLATDIRRVTMISQAQENEAKHTSWFWCVEEHETGIRVTQRHCTTFQERQSLWLAGILLPDWWMWTVDTKPQGIVAYQNSLYIIGIDQEKQLVLYQVQ